MRGKVAKAIRRALGFHPSEPRQYEDAQGVMKVIKNFAEKPRLFECAGTRKSVGKRAEYQAVKRRGMHKILLGVTG